MRTLTIAILTLIIGCTAGTLRADHAQPDQQPALQENAAEQERTSQTAKQAPTDQQAQPETKKDDRADDEVPDPKKPFGFWMEKKLEYSQLMLKGLAIGDLELVNTKARQMRVLSRAEGWIRRGKPGYTAQLQAFNFANAEIERHAKAGNLEGAAMGFQQLTISCVSCHSILRNRN